VNGVIPFYNRLESLHANARELPRLARWPKIASVIDGLVSALTQTNTPVPQLLREADKNASGIV
jgi:multiple sugar transport system substrate-binding protein